jgi:hypothetical protein
MRPRYLGDDAPDLVDSVDSLRLGGIDSGVHKELAALDRSIETLGRVDVGAGHDLQLGVTPRVERCPDAGEHLIDRCDSLAREIAALVWKVLVGIEEAGHSGGLEGADHLTHIVWTPEPGVGVDTDRNLDRRAYPGVVVGVVTDVALSKIGRPEHAADRGVAPGAHDLEAARSINRAESAS